MTNWETIRDYLAIADDNIRDAFIAFLDENNLDDALEDFEICQIVGWGRSDHHGGQAGGDN